MSTLPELFPRAGGGGPFAMALTSGQPALPPRGRGRATMKIYGVVREGSSPARAGAGRSNRKL